MDGNVPDHPESRVRTLGRLLARRVRPCPKAPNARVRFRAEIEPGGAVARGVDYLMRTQGSDGFWEEERFTGTGFPRVFYLRYHGYRKYFPLWALARYRRLRQTNERFAFGM